LNYCSLWGINSKISREWDGFPNKHAVVVCFRECPRIRVSNRTHEWAADATQQAYTLTDGGIDVSPARLSQLADNVFGGTGRFMQSFISTPSPDTGFGESPVTQAVTRAFRHKDDPFAARDHLADTNAALQAADRRVFDAEGVLPGDMLASSERLKQAQRIMRRVENQTDEITVEGLTQSEIYTALEAAEANGDQAEAMRLNRLLGLYYDQADQIRGEAINELNNLAEQGAL
jgi:hypothetical protein